HPHLRTVRYQNVVGPKANPKMSWTTTVSLFGARVNDSPQRRLDAAAAGLLCSLFYYYNAILT
ncbi:hypothetical protein, partial [Candidatus Entotheonella palauensis]|uniref:hypothetical protein n=1 Tax=Candidatus Entotheonella palauensis TaxID=93172 RepID=UPI001C4E0560